MTIFADGFDSGQFQVSDALPPDASSYLWRGTNPGGFHRWVVLTKHGETWTRSEIASFSGAVCVADEVASPK